MGGTVEPPEVDIDVKVGWKANNLLNSFAVLNKSNSLFDSFFPIEKS